MELSWNVALLRASLAFLHREIRDKGLFPVLGGQGEMILPGGEEESFVRHWGREKGTGRTAMVPMFCCFKNSCDSVYKKITTPLKKPKKREVKREGVFHVGGELRIKRRGPQKQESTIKGGACIL